MSRWKDTPQRISTVEFWKQRKVSHNPKAINHDVYAECIYDAPDFTRKVTRLKYANSQGDFRYLLDEEMEAVNPDDYVITQTKLEQTWESTLTAPALNLTAKIVANVMTDITSPKDHRVDKFPVGSAYLTDAVPCDVEQFLALPVYWSVMIMAYDDEDDRCYCKPDRVAAYDVADWNLCGVPEHALRDRFVFVIKPSLSDPDPQDLRLPRTLEDAKRLAINMMAECAKAALEYYKEQSEEKIADMQKQLDLRKLEVQAILSKQSHDRINATLIHVAELVKHLPEQS